MAVRKITTTEANKAFDLATNYARMSRDDPNDPASRNFLTALHNYITSLAAAQVEMVSGINDLLERVDKIQTKVDAQR